MHYLLFRSASSHLPCAALVHRAADITSGLRMQLVLSADMNYLNIQPIKMAQRQHADGLVHRRLPDPDDLRRPVRRGRG
jgi:hypothetical protein